MEGNRNMGLEENKKGNSENDMIKNFIEAGRIANKILKETKKLVMPGQSILDIAETMEKRIYEEGARPGFPVNICTNETAAHFTPPSDYKGLIDEKDVVKIDFGVHIEGCISDNAITIDFTKEHGNLVEASENALNAAISTMRAGKHVGEIGKVIEYEIRRKGFVPIENLTGHMILPYRLHVGPIIPNIGKDSGYVLKEGDVFAIEPFATDGKGSVKDANIVEIYSIAEIKNIRLRKSREVFAYAFENFFTLPFAKRWLEKRFKSRVLLGLSLRELLNADVFYQYPVLKEVENGIVSQAEKTVIVEKDSVRVLE